MTKVISFLAGKKTYLVAIVGLVYGLVNNDMQIVMNSLLAMTGRAAISKLQ